MKELQGGAHKYHHMRGSLFVGGTKAIVTLLTQYTEVSIVKTIEPSLNARQVYLESIHALCYKISC